MKDSLGFTFNGTHSKSLGVVQVHSSSGLFTEEMFMNSTLNNVTSQKNGRVISAQRSFEPIEFDLTLYYSDPDRSKGTVRRIIKWLQTETFEAMTFDEHPNFLVYGQLKEIVEIQHNGLNEGLITVKILTNSSHIFSTPYLTTIYTVDTTKNIFLNHEGDLPTYPKIWIEKIGSGELSIYNNTNKQTMSFTELTDKEKLFIDGEKRIIYSNAQELGVYRGNSHNRIWLSLTDNHFDGTNEILISGDCKIQFEIQYKYNTIL